MPQSLFDFIIQNASQVEALITLCNGDEIEIAPDEFDFSHPDLQFEWGSNRSMKFVIKIGAFAVLTNVLTSDLKSIMPYLGRVSSPTVREAIIHNIEDEMLTSSEDEVESAANSLTEAQAAMVEATENMNTIKSALQLIKQKWGII